MKPFMLTPGTLTLADLRSIFKNHTTYQLELNPESFSAINAATKTVVNIISEKKTVYGINTGFGLLASTRIADEDLQLLQKSLVLSHSTGVGQLLDDEVVALVMLLKVNSLSRGYSGIRLEVIQLLIQLFNQRVYPCIPAKGSVGASGDLAPLAHMSCALIGESNVRYQGKVRPAAEVLAELNLKPISLGPKEGLALLNGTNVSTALALKGLFLAENNFMAALVAGALSVDAAMGSSAPFDPRIQEVRGHRGQIEVAKIYRELLTGSEIRLSHEHCDRVQDPYSLRCQPQVMGACLDQMRYTASIMLIEANAVSDNPLVFSDSGDILSGGNFHAEPIALCSDTLATSMCEVGSISERRTALLLDSNLSTLPAFLVNNSGVNSGFMIAQVTAAALVSENKSLAHPSSVDSIPTSANQEDHVSMATYGARRLTDIAENVTAIIAIECLSAAQGIELRKPMKTSSLLDDVIAIIRNKIPFYEKDRFFADDINNMQAIIVDGDFSKLVMNAMSDDIF